MADPDMGGRPMSAKELTEKAKQFDWNPRIGFKYWARAAETIHHEGQVYLREGNLPQAYLVLFRYSILVLEFLPKHPESKEPEARKAIRPLQKRIPRVIETLERLRPEIEEAYDRYEKISSARRASMRNTTSFSQSSYAKHAANDPALSWSYVDQASILDARDNQDLAVDLARKEMRRRRRAAGVWDSQDFKNTLAFRDGHTSPSEKPSSTPYGDDGDLQRQMEATRRQLDHSVEYKRGYVEDDITARTAVYHYPSITKSTPLSYENPAHSDRFEISRPQPPRPPKERYIDRSPPRLPPPLQLHNLSLDLENPRTPPPLPIKEPVSRPPARDYSPATREPPTVSSSLAVPAEPAKRVTFRPAAYLENGDPLRPVFLPSTLRHRFLQLASENTRRGLEMCGMLCGTTVNNALFISHLVIPEQRCTPDTCETENESAMLDYCIENDLIVIGWIHTHPTQTCFMSSRDLHTQAGYQVMMPESIAIVCAPQFEPSWGIFRLTNPPGLPHLLSCQRTETFHQHSVDNLYVEAGHPQGHVYESKTLEFEVCDLRPGRS
ncbi:hypothetical protein VTJ83DRAFT_3637 [Remersonia thermophila]|uniref:MPN domain-containing protein n=1 Tax=Remersonia thermophila TaxID=72144 RepID=A0ABR4DG19_9PEZI